jgi:putative Holliday junction resolvase
MRILSIDYGKKRTGIAVSDNLQMIAGGLATVDTPLLSTFLQDYFTKEQVGKIVIGYPKHLNNQPADIVPEIENFAKTLQKNFPDKEIIFFDERFTSKIAFQTMIDGGLSKKQRQNKALVDKISAVVILQNYMESQRKFC